MIDYEKLATLLLRVIAVCWTIFIASAWSIYGIELAAGISVQHYPVHTIIGNVGYVILGLLVLAMSKSLGKLLSRGLRDQV